MSETERKKLTERLLSSIEQELERLRALGWGREEFAKALRNLLEIRPHGLRCPRCLNAQVHIQGGAFIEQGEWEADSQRYEREGEADHWVCTACGFGFLEWTVAANGHTSKG